MPTSQRHTSESPSLLGTQLLGPCRLLVPYQHSTLILSTITIRRPLHRRCPSFTVAATGSHLNSRMVRRALSCGNSRDRQAWRDRSWLGGRHTMLHPRRTDRSSEPAHTGTSNLRSFTDSSSPHMRTITRAPLCSREDINNRSRSRNRHKLDITPRASSRARRRHIMGWGGRRAQCLGSRSHQRSFMRGDISKEMFSQ